MIDRPLAGEAPHHRFVGAGGWRWLHQWLRGVWGTGLLLLASLTSPAAQAETRSGLLAFLKPAPNVLTAEPLTKTNTRPADLHPARQVIERNPIHDEANPDRHLLQRIDEATRHIKKDAVGFPDWMSAIRSGVIRPLSSLDGTGGMNLLDLDIIMRNTREMPHVKFPHLSHTMWLDCSNCHPVPFVARAGANSVSMERIFRGEFCGMCHDRVAFVTFFSCERCHIVPQVSDRRSPGN